MTSISLPQEHGLNKRAVMTSIIINDEHKYINVLYKEELLAPDGTVINVSDVKSYTLTGLDFDNWDNQIGIPVIRPAIVSRLNTIYGI